MKNALVRFTTEAVGHETSSGIKEVEGGGSGA